MVPTTCPPRTISGRQQEEEYELVHHVQLEHLHHQSYFLHQYQNASIQDGQIQCKKDQMQVPHLHSNTVP